MIQQDEVKMYKVSKKNVTAIVQFKKPSYICTRFRAESDDVMLGSGRYGVRLEGTI